MNATNAPSIYIAPCMKFTTRIMPNTMLRPRLIKRDEAAVDEPVEDLDRIKPSKSPAAPKRGAGRRAAGHPAYRAPHTVRHQLWAQVLSASGMNTSLPGMVAMTS